MDNASITTCTQEVPDWSFSASKARIDFGEYFKAKDAYGKSKTRQYCTFPILYGLSRQKGKVAFCYHNLDLTIPREHSLHPNISGQWMWIKT